MGAGRMPITWDRKVNSMKLLLKFIKDHSGATQIEYALIGTLISVAIISGVGAVGSDITNLYTYLSVKAVPVLK